MESELTQEQLIEKLIAETLLWVQRELTNSYHYCKNATTREAVRQKVSDLRDFIVDAEAIIGYLVQIKNSIKEAPQTTTFVTNPLTPWYWPSECNYGDFTPKEF